MALYFICQQYLRTEASTAERAAMATSLVGAAVIIGRLGSGYLLDRLFAPRVAILFYGATALGIAMLCTGTAWKPRARRLISSRARHGMQR